MAKVKSCKHVFHLTWRFLSPRQKSQMAPSAIKIPPQFNAKVQHLFSSNAPDGREPINTLLKSHTNLKTDIIFSSLLKNNHIKKNENGSRSIRKPPIQPHSRSCSIQRTEFIRYWIDLIIVGTSWIFDF